jgi:rsbT co-antagonist protein RsbR
MWDIIQRLESIVAGLQETRGLADVVPLSTTLRELLTDCGRVDAEYARLEAVQDQVTAQRQLLDSLGCPVLRVRHDVLCAPLIGPYDRERSGQLRDAVLHEVGRTGARLVVFDLTGAVIPDPSAAEHLVLTCRTLRLLGARAALSGLSPQVAQMLSGGGGEMLDVPTFLSLEAALTSVSS